MTQNIFLPSMPSLAAHYGVSYTTVQMSVPLYLALSGILQIFIGPLADRYGRRPVILTGFVIFLIATVGILLAPTVEIFLIFRMMQAVIALGLALSRAVVRDMVPAQEAAAMIGWVTMGMSLAPMFSPSLGGFLDQAFGWQSSFVFLLVVGCAVALLIWADLGETTQRRSSSLLAQMRSYPTLLSSRSFWGFAVAGAAGTGSFFCFLGGAPAVGTDVFHLTPFELGLYFAAPGVGYMLGNFLSAKFATRLGIVPMVFLGSSVIAASLALMLALALSGLLTHPILFFGPMCLASIGNGLALPSANSGMMSVNPELIGSASGLGGALTIGGGAALSAMAAWAMQSGDGLVPLVVLMNLSGLVAVIAVWMVRQDARNQAS